MTVIIPNSEGNVEPPSSFYTGPDMVNHPPHYTRGPLLLLSYGTKTIERTVECIEVIRHIKDMRLATAMKYIWRVAFGGKGDGSRNDEDIKKAIWYLNDYLENKV